MLTTLDDRYIYDGATGRLYKADEATYSSVRASIDAIQAGALDPAEMPHIAYVKARPENASAPLSSHLGYPSKIVITITEQCNLRCNYCPYPTDPTREHHVQGTHFDEFSIRNVLEFLVHNVGPETALSFYGGEPLYRFKDIKLLVEQLRRARSDWKALFSITTNLTVSSTAVLDWVVDQRAVLLISLDGPKQINDRNRPTDTQSGSFERVMKNLDVIRERHPNHYRQFVALNVVIATTEFDEIDKFFASRFADVALIRFAAASYHGSDEVERVGYQNVHSELEKWALQKLASLQNVESLKGTPLTLDFVRKSILSVMSRGSLEDGRKKFTSCAPGDKMIINSDGSIGVCEKAEAIALGSVADGATKRHDIADEFVALLSNRCRFCFAAPCCNVCYAMVWDGEKLSRNLLDRYCETFRGRTRRMLNTYVSLRERFADFDRRVVAVCSEGNQHLFDEE